MTELQGVVVRWIDGDTLIADVRILDITHHLRIRLARCDAPPIDTPEGLRALATMQKAAPPGMKVTIKVVDRDRYQRIVANVIANGRDLSEIA